MANNRMILEHVDTGEQVVIAKFWPDRGWEPCTPGLERLDEAFGAHHVNGRDYAEEQADGTRLHEKCWRLVYEHERPL
jgi:hypothetical protein